MRIIREINNVDDLLEYVYDKKQIYIYGAGRVGLLIYYILQEESIIPDAFFVSKCINKEKDILGVPVIQYGNLELGNDIGIIVAALGKNQEEILSNFNIDTCVITKKMYDENYEKYKNDIEESILVSQKFLYRGSEKVIYNNYFNNIDAGKLELLLDGLDDASCNIIKRCIERINLINSVSVDEIDLFTNDEKQKMLEATKYIKNNVKKHSEDSWSCNDFFLPINDFRAEIFYDRLGIERVNDLEKCKDKTIIDVGGYIGDSALVLSRLTSDKVYVFEPLQKYIELIHKTKELNNITNIIPVNMAVSEHSGKDIFEIGETNYTSGLNKIGGRKYNEQVEVDVVSIDEYVEDNNLTVGLIKIHAEGAEQKVLRGAKKTIEKQAPILIVEINHTESDFFDIKPLIEQINPNYQFAVYKPANGCVCLGTKIIAEVRR